MASNPFANLGSIFDPQQALAQQAQQSALQQALSSPVGDNLVRALSRNNVSSPNLDFSVNARGTGEGIVQGLGNAVNNALKLRAVKTQQDQMNQLVDLARQRDLAQALQEKQAQVQRDLNIQRGNEAIGSFFPKGTDLGAIQRANTISGGTLFSDLAKQASLNQLDLAKSGAETRQKNQINRDEIASNYDLFNKAGVNLDTPEGQNLYRAFFGFDPATPMDLEGQRLETQGKRLSNIKAYIDTKYADKNAMESLRAKYLKNEITADELERINLIQPTLDAALGKIRSGEGLTSGEMFELQAQLGLLTKNDPEFGKLFQQYGFITKDKKGNYSFNKKGMQTFLEGNSVPAPKQDTAPKQEAKQTQTPATIGEAIGQKVQNDLVNPAFQKTRDLALRSIPGAKLLQQAGEALKPFSNVGNAFGALLNLPIPTGERPDLAGTQQDLAKAGRDAGEKKQAALNKANEADQRVKQGQQLLDQYNQLEEEARAQQAAIDKLLQKYGGVP